jgi:integrase/recombinase XerD
MPGQAKVLSFQDIQNVFKQLDNLRDRTIFALGVYTGMRISEIISLKKEQVFTAGGIKYILVVPRLKKKNTVYSEIPITPKLRQVLIDYKKHLDQLDESKLRGEDSYYPFGQASHYSESPWLFPSSESEKGHLTRTQAHNVLVSAFKALKLEGAKTHSMRRTLLTTLSRAGVPLRTVQDISGHSSLSQLQAYLEVDPEDKQRAMSVVKYCRLTLQNC